MARKPRSSLNDIARHLGISAMTVSRVVNNSGAVSPDTRQRVEDALRELGFRKDRFASINARRRGGGSGSWSVVVDAILEAEGERDAYDFYARIALATVRRLEEAGCQVELSDLTRQPERGARAVSGADAVVFCSPVGDDVVRRVTTLNPGMVRVSAFHAQPRASLVGPDDAAAGAMAAELAARGGHRQVAVLASAHASHGLRAAAFVARMRELSPSAQVAVLSYPLLPDGIHSDDAVIDGLLAAHRASASSASLFFATGGHATLRAYRFLRAHGIAVPGQVALLGFDALPFYDHLDIPITRIAFGVAAVGQRLAEEAVRLLADEAEEPARILLPCTLVEGRSFVDAAAMPDRVQHAP